MPSNRFIIDYENPDAGIGHSLGFINSAIKIAFNNQLQFAFSPSQVKKSSSKDFNWICKQFIRKISFRKTYETHEIGDDLNFLFAFASIFPDRSLIEEKIKNNKLRLLELPYPIKLQIPSNDLNDSDVYDEINEFINSHPENDIVFKLPKRRHADYEYQSSRHIFLEAYKIGRLNNPIPIEFSSQEINVAVHIRRGDLLPGRQYQDLRDRMLSDEWYMKILDLIIQHLSNEKITLHIFSEGVNGQYLNERGQPFSWSKNFSSHQNILVREWVDSSFIKSFHHLINADVLIGSKSGMSHLAGMFNNQLKIMPKMWHSYRGADKVIELESVHSNSNINLISNHIALNKNELINLSKQPNRYDQTL
jgi:hypothetical protein